MAVTLNRDNLTSLCAMAQTHLHILEAIKEEDYNALQAAMKEAYGFVLYSSKAAAMAEERMLLEKLKFMLRETR